MACLMSVDDEIERCSMSSDKLRFFKMGFFVAKEFVLDKWLAGGADSESSVMALPLCRGP